MVTLKQMTTIGVYENTVNEKTFKADLKKVGADNHITNHLWDKFLGYDRSFNKLMWSADDKTTILLAKLFSTTPKVINEIAYFSYNIGGKRFEENLKKHSKRADLNKRLVERFFGNYKRTDIIYLFRTNFEYADLIVKVINEGYK